MGERDWWERQKIKITLNQAWTKWTKGIRDHQTIFPPDPVPNQTSSVHYESEAEDDPRKYETDLEALEDRNNQVESFTSSFFDGDDTGTATL